MTGGVVTKWMFQGNSPYDPDYAGSGTSANLWATMSAWYNKYMCTYSKIKFQWQTQTVGALQLQYWVGKRSLNQAAPSTFVEAAAQPRYRTGQRQMIATQASNNLTFYMKDSTKHMLGRKLDPSMDRVLITQNPDEQWIYEFAMLTSAQVTVNGLAWITYWVEFSDPETVAST